MRRNRPEAEIPRAWDRLGQGYRLVKPQDPMTWGRARNAVVEVSEANDLASTMSTNPRRRRGVDRERTSVTRTPRADGLRTLAGENTLRLPAMHGEREQFFQTRAPLIPPSHYSLSSEVSAAVCNNADMGAPVSDSADMPEPNTTVRVRRRSLKRLKLAAALRGISMIQLIDELAQQAFERAVKGAAR